MTSYTVIPSIRQPRRERIRGRRHRQLDIDGHYQFRAHRNVPQASGGVHRGAEASTRRTSAAQRSSVELTTSGRLDRPLPADDERHDQARLDPLAEHLRAETQVPEHPVPESEHAAPPEPGRLVHAQVNSPAGSSGIQPYHGGSIRQDGRMCRSPARTARERSKEKKESGHFQMDSGRRSLQTYDIYIRNYKSDGQAGTRPRVSNGYGNARGRSGRPCSGPPNRSRAGARRGRRAGAYHDRIADAGRMERSLLAHLTSVCVCPPTT